MMDDGDDGGDDIDLLMLGAQHFLRIFCTPVMSLVDKQFHGLATIVRCVTNNAPKISDGVATISTISTISTVSVRFSVEEPLPSNEKRLDPKSAAPVRAHVYSKQWRVRCRRRTCCLRPCCGQPLLDLRPYAMSRLRR